MEKKMEVSNKVVRFTACIGRSNNPVVHRFINRGDGKGESAANRLRVWSPFDLLVGEFVERRKAGDGMHKGFYTRGGCEERVAKLNAEDKGRYLRLSNGLVKKARAK